MLILVLVSPEYVTEWNMQRYDCTVISSWPVNVNVTTVGPLWAQPTSWMRKWRPVSFAANSVQCFILWKPMRVYPMRVIEIASSAALL
jgi:hypothetical protein